MKNAFLPTVPGTKSLGALDLSPQRMKRLFVDCYFLRFVFSHSHFPLPMSDFSVQLFACFFVFLSGSAKSMPKPLSLGNSPFKSLILLQFQTVCLVFPKKLSIPNDRRRRCAHSRVIYEGSSSSKYLPAFKATAGTVASSTW